MIAVLIAVSLVLLLSLLVLLFSGAVSFECRHKALTEVQEDGRQYCTVCNKAFVPPAIPCEHTWELFGRDKQKCSKCGELREIPVAGCQHKWKPTGERSLTNNMTGMTTAVITILTCEKCGEMKKFTVTNTEQSSPSPQ